MNVAGLENIKCCKTVLMNVSITGSLPLGRVHIPLHLEGWSLECVVVLSSL